MNKNKVDYRLKVFLGSSAKEGLSYCAKSAKDALLKASTSDARIFPQ